MRIREIDDIEPGKRIRVTCVAPSAIPEDEGRLLGQTGTVSRYNGIQLVVDWDGPSPGGLMLAMDDEIEVIE